MEQIGSQGFDVVERIRLLETKYNNVRERILIVNQNMIQSYKTLSNEVKGLNEDIKEIKTDIFEIKEGMNKLIHELKFFADKNSLKVLEKYINMWNPLHFVTEKEVIELIKKRGGKRTNKKRK